MADPLSPSPRSHDSRGAIGVGMLAATLAGFIGGLLGVLVGVSLPGVLSPQGTQPVKQDVTNYDAQ
ncbi:MAG TPA: hypothetical protein VE781_04030 [Kineosporiaceae bacterium]|jgi:hypothetical protein|nr:hypothetical protein [Kineosporiaceae bacterium]